MGMASCICTVVTHRCGGLLQHWLDGICPDGRHGYQYIFSDMKHFEVGASQLETKVSWDLVRIL